MKLTIESVTKFISTLDESEQRKIAEGILHGLGLGASMWSFTDIAWQGREDGYDLTEEQAKEILDWIERKHDASIGINWEVISTYISMYVDDNEVAEFEGENTEIWD